MCCLGREQRHLCNRFDASECSEDGCELGFVTDEFQCVISCQCAKEGTLETDIFFDARDVQKLLDVSN